MSLFASGKPRWLSVERDGKPTGPRLLLAAVPYAVAAATAGNASSLGGRPASDYLLSPKAGRNGKDGSNNTTTVDRNPGPSVNNGSTGFIGKFFNTVDLDNSALFQSGSSIGLGTTAPLDIFHSRFTNNNGGLTGIAVQNLGNNANSYSGMLFYDQNGALGQFQGFNNSTHEYRINNIGTSGTINFMIGSSSMFRVMNNGDIGLGAGTNTPDVKLHMFSNGVDGVTVRGSRLGGTIAAPTAVTSGASLVRLEASGYNGATFTASRGLIRMASTENWTATANGTAMEFATTTNGTAFASTRMSILNNGDVEVGASNDAVKVLIGPLAGNAGNLNVSADGNGVQGVAMFDRLNDDGTLVRFRRNGITVGTIDVAAGVVSYNAFTGSHFAQTDDPIERGMLVSFNGKNGRLEDNPTSEILYGVTKTQRANDPAVLGAYLARQNYSAAELANSVNPHLVEAVGNGEMWVVDTGRDVAAGDYLVSSAVAGHAMTDPETFDVSHIVARVAEPVDWKTVTDTVQGPDGREHKRALISVLFENFVIDRTRRAETDAELVSMRKELATLTTQLAALESMLKTQTTAVQQQQQR